ncbi:MAG: hypothetical protein Q8R28_01860, partial [Dehalococcoidia bacterium]|nr:hypothetical protein [Dehalococcoidia bacterium]
MPAHDSDDFFSSGQFSGEERIPGSPPPAQQALLEELMDAVLQFESTLTERGQYRLQHPMDIYSRAVNALEEARDCRISHALDWLG